MKKLIMALALVAFAASVCFAADEAPKAKATDPITATVETVATIVKTPVEAVFGQKEKAKETKEAAKEAAKPVK